MARRLELAGRVGKGLRQGVSAKVPRQFVAQPYAYHQELELRIDSLTNEGRGLARHEGWVIFVGFALPGELVRVRIYRNHRNYSEADLLEVLEPSPSRVAPRCALFGQCGGCQYQHLDYAEQLLWKQRQVQELLRHLARIEHPVEPVIASPIQYGYRSKITPHFQRPKQGEVGAIGFLRAGSRHALVDVTHCDLAMPALNEALGAARDQARAGQLKRGATLLLRAADNGVLTRSDALACERVGELRFEFLAGDFFQNNPFILPHFVDYAVREAQAAEVPLMIDAYCGSGLFAIAAAAHFKQVIGVEVAASAVERAAHNAALNGLDNCSFLAADASAIFARIDQPGAQSVVLMDPPRAGSSPEFLDQLIAFGPKRVIYVSCNPATQMRDLAHLSAQGYALRRVQPFDLFPQTRHLECVMTLDRAG